MNISARFQGRRCLIFWSINNQLTHRYWSGWESLPGFAAPATAGAGRWRALAAAFCRRPLEIFSSRVTSRPTTKSARLPHAMPERRIRAIGRADKRESFSMQDSAADRPIGPLIKLDVTWNYNSATADPRAQSAYSSQTGTGDPGNSTLQRRRSNPLYSAQILCEFSSKSTQKNKVHTTAHRCGPSYYPTPAR